MKFGYVRIGKTDPNLEQQLEELRAYGVDEIYEDAPADSVDYSPQLNLLLSKISPGDTLVILSLDRLGRSAKKLLTLIEEFEVLGINFVSLQEGLDTTTETGKVCSHMLCAVAQMERNLASERTNVGLAKANAEGRKNGRKSVDENKLNQAFKMYYAGQFPIKEITKKTGVARSTLYKHLALRK